MNNHFPAKYYTFIAYITLSLFFVSFGCNKDSLDILSKTYSESVFFQKGYIENLNPSIVKNNSISTRSISIIDSLYLYLTEQNHDYHFAEHIINNVGYPSWMNCFVLPDTINGGNLISLPFLSADESSVQGILLISERNGNFFEIEIYGKEAILTFFYSMPDRDSWKHKFHAVAHYTYLNQNIFGHDDDAEIIGEWINDVLNEYYFTPVNSTVNSPVAQNSLAFLQNCATEVPLLNRIGHRDPIYNDFINCYWVCAESCPPLHASIAAQYGRFICKRYELVCISMRFIRSSDFWYSNPYISGGGGAGASNPCIQSYLSCLATCELDDLEFNSNGNNNRSVCPQNLCQEVNYLYGCLEFIGNNSFLLAWYLCYNDTKDHNAWNSLLSFSCHPELTPADIEDALTYFKELQELPIPPFNNFGSFANLWIQTSELKHKEGVRDDIMNFLVNCNTGVSASNLYIINSMIEYGLVVSGSNYIHIDICDEESEFYNWYIENIDGGLDYGSSGATWENHNPISPQTLPTLSAFNNGMPRTSDGLHWLTGADNIYPLVGGSVEQARINDVANGAPYPTTNTCALKISIALNASGVTIPHIWSDDDSDGIKDANESNITLQGADGKYYFLRAEWLVRYCLEVFPEPDKIVTRQNILNGATTQSAFGENQGIYLMLPYLGANWDASGHCDFRYYLEDPSPRYVTAAGYKWNWVGTAYLWILE